MSAATEAMIKSISTVDLLTGEEASAYEQKIEKEKAHFQKFRGNLKAKRKIKKQPKIGKPKK